MSTSAADADITNRSVPVLQMHDVHNSAENQSGSFLAQDKSTPLQIFLPVLQKHDETNRPNPAENAIGTF